jgi:hypothetical protein
VTERKEVQKPDRQERLRIPPVFRHLAFDGDDVREDVPVREDHAFRFRGGAGGEDDLGDGGGGWFKRFKRFKGFKGFKGFAGPEPRE